MTQPDGDRGRSRADLAALVREYLLLGHLIDRAGMPHLIGPYGRDGMAAIAVDEWMGASPVYTRRMQQALGFTGDDVTTVFKGMQLDIGAPPEFMDFRYVGHDTGRGEFQLAHCGALVDVEPMGDDYVVAMCHHIEDPTFDATALATHPGARGAPRPPAAAHSCGPASALPLDRRDRPFGPGAPRPGRHVAHGADARSVH